MSRRPAPRPRRRPRVVPAALLGLLAAGLWCAAARAAPPSRAERPRSPSAHATPAPGARAEEFPALEALEREVERLVEVVRPSVVGVVASSPLEGLLDALGDSVRIEGVEAGRRSPIARRVGSGIVLDGQGHIVTLASVVSGSSEVAVLASDGSRLAASISGLDDYSGLAVLRATNPRASMRPLPFAEPDSVKVGSLVTTFASPGSETGGAPIYTVGFVSGMGVSPGPIRRGPYLRLNAPAAPGSGGGAVLDTRGRLVGIVFGADGAAMARRGPIQWESREHARRAGPYRLRIQVPDQGGPDDASAPPSLEPLEEPGAPGAPDAVIPEEISLHILEALHRAGVAGGGESYAVPVEVVRHVAGEIISKGTVRRGWVGVKIEETEPGEVRLLSVLPGGPADKAGLRAGDRILAFSLGPGPEEPLPSSAVLVDRLAFSDPGTPLRLSVSRDEGRRTFTLLLGEPPAPPPAPRPGPAPQAFRMRRPILGVDVDQEIDDELRARLGAQEGLGLLVTRVHASSRAETAGMRPGDLIVEALGGPIRSLADLRRALERQGSERMTIRVLREGRQVALEVPPAPALPPPTPPPPARAPSAPPRPPA